LIGEKFLAALGMAALVDVAAFAVQPIEFTKRIVAAAKTINVSFRMSFPIRVSVHSISLFVLPFDRLSNGLDRNLVFHAISRFFSCLRLNRSAGPIDTRGCGREWAMTGGSDVGWFRVASNQCLDRSLGQ
jgi:hypothetical protein